MGKKKTRKIGLYTKTVGEFIKDLKTAFDPDDDIIVLTMCVCAKENVIDVENNQTAFTLNSISRSLAQIDADRKERNNQ